MQFIANGPDIPEELLRLQEEGRVVFFCGAGISYPAGLPGFKDLVNKVYKDIGTSFKPEEKEAFRHNQFDATLNLLEQRVPGQRLRVRKAIMNALRPKLQRKGSIDTHISLLQLAKTHKGPLRLVTTNFDCLFTAAIKTLRQKVNTYSAPMLPVPKHSRWDGIVYLHGVLPETEDENALNQMVVTSGDFGLAYLTERWASRFVTELFRNYVVCFVGYSIGDPILRYMMDALAADKMLGSHLPQVYVLAACKPGQNIAEIEKWGAKGVTPILYEAAKQSDHSTLHLSLKKWAEIYLDGSLGKERIVAELSMSHPLASTTQDDFVGRMLWALSDKSGLPAKRFAEYDPVPSFEWIEAFSENRYNHRDLENFGITGLLDKDNNFCFSLISHPSPYSNAPWMRLASGGSQNSRLDNVMHHLAFWLTRHLDDPKLILWIAQQGGKVNEQWAWIIQNRLNLVYQWEKEENFAELEKLKANAPRAIPRRQMRTAWQLLLDGRLKSIPQEHRRDIYNWKDRLNHNGLTASLRMELRELLKPYLIVREPFHFSAKTENQAAQADGKPPFSWSIALACDQQFKRTIERTNQAITDFKKRAGIE